MPPSVPTRKREVFEYDTGTVLYCIRLFFYPGRSQMLL